MLDEEIDRFSYHPDQGIAYLQRQSAINDVSEFDHLRESSSYKNSKIREVLNQSNKFESILDEATEETEFFAKFIKFIASPRNISR